MTTGYVSGAAMMQPMNPAELATMERTCNSNFKLALQQVRSQLDWLGSDEKMNGEENGGALLSFNLVGERAEPIPVETRAPPTPERDTAVLTGWCGYRAWGDGFVASDYENLQACVRPSSANMESSAASFARQEDREIIAAVFGPALRTATPNLANAGLPNDGQVKVPFPAKQNLSPYLGVSDKTQPNDKELGITLEKFSYVAAKQLTLSGGNIQSPKKKFLVLTPRIYAQLFSIPEFTNNQFVKYQPLNDAEVPYVMGHYIICSEYLPRRLREFPDTRAPGGLRQVPVARCFTASEGALGRRRIKEPTWKFGEDVGRSFRMRAYAEAAFGYCRVEDYEFTAFECFEPDAADIEDANPPSFP